MKYHGAHEGYKPEQLDKQRVNMEDSPWPFKFRPFELKATTGRHPKYKAFKKRFADRRRKHGRTTNTAR